MDSAQRKYKHPAIVERLQCRAYLQLGELALSSASLLGGKVAGLDGLRQIQLAALKHLVGCLQLPLQIHHLRAVHWIVLAANMSTART